MLTSLGTVLRPLLPCEHAIKPHRIHASREEFPGHHHRNSGDVEHRPEVTGPRTGSSGNSDVDDVDRRATTSCFNERLAFKDKTPFLSVGNIQAPKKCGWIQPES